VLDSFAGSGTTAQAVLALNKADGGDRKFILIQLPETIPETSPAYAKGFRQVVDVTAERVRRVINGVRDAKDKALKAGLGGSFTYCELGEPMDLERFFAGEGKAPSWEAVARYVAYTATGETLVPDGGGDGFAGYAGEYRLHLLYRPDPKWMRSNEAMLDLTTAERISGAAKADNGKPVLVFAAGKLMGQRTLTELGITFCQLPYSVHRILGEGTEGVAGIDAA
jgi:adenine-specific DNA-methyltransferase